MTQAADYYDNVNPDLLYRIPCHLKGVRDWLRFRCFGSCIQRKNPNVFYVGVEFEENAAAKAKNVLIRYFAAM